MDRYEMPEDLRTAVARFAVAAATAGIQLTYFDLDMALPRREHSSREIEAALLYLSERDILLCEDK